MGLLRSRLSWLFLLTLLGGRTLKSQVRIWRGSIEIPTYLLGPPDPNPAFPLVNGHLIYPYTMMDDLTRHRAEETYRAIYLENSYLKLTILPGLGGRLYSVYDKVDGREVLYRNNVVKYGLVGVRGAWISGGIEFNFPNAHTVVTVSPVESVVRQNPDGSATAVVGAMDWVSGMHWEIALTLAPHSSRVQQNVTLFNSTPQSNLYWFWCNAAVKATNDMQFVYPMRETLPDDPFGVIEPWPVSHGVNESWYRNLRHATAIFGRDVHRQFFGVYYHQSDYGVVHAADYRKDPGKKIWSWGTAGDGLIWTHLLTDNDGPYNEIQSGRFATQVYREFMRPRRVEDWTEYWYPVRGLDGGFVAASDQLALNVTTGGTEDHPAETALRISPAVEIHGARIRVMTGQKLLRDSGPLTFEPLKPFELTVPLPGGEAAKKQLAVDVQSADGRSLLRWSAAEPIDGNPDFIPAAGTHPAEVTYNAKTPLEELYLHGVWLERRGQPQAAQRVFEQVLDRDPDYLPALLKEAWRAYRAADFETARSLTARALSRDPNNPTARYAAGVVERAAGNDTLAQDDLWTAIHFGGPPAPAYVELGEIAIRQRNFARATHLLKRSLDYNPDDALARTDLAVAMRLNGDTHDAGEVSAQALREMPLLPYALVEHGFDAEPPSASTASGDRAPAAWNTIIGFDPQNDLAVAAWYHGLKDFHSSDAVLHTTAARLSTAKPSPMLYYYLAASARQEGEAALAQEDSRRAASLPCDPVFPNRVADAAVLREAMALNPSDTCAAYALGNFLFAHGRYEEAQRLWLQSLRDGFNAPVLLRNLGVYEWKVKGDLAAAAGYYQRAVRLQPHDFRFYADLDEIDESRGDDSARAEMFRSAPPEVMEHDTVRSRKVLFLIEQGQFAKALSLLQDHEFRPWEGGVELHELYVAAKVGEGKAELAANQPQGAARDFSEAMEYPENLGVGKPDQPEQSEQLYWLGVALDAEGETTKAGAAWQQAAAEGSHGRGATTVFGALALERLGKDQAAQTILARWANLRSDPHSTAYEDWVAGVAEEARHRLDAAQEDFTRALKLNPQLWRARLALQELGPISDRARRKGGVSNHTS
jgi:tetratricopeptide (TPR) repeat protein